MNARAGRQLRLASVAALAASILLGAPAAGAATLPDVTSPKWQGAMEYHELPGHPDWPDVIQLDGSIDSQIWPAMPYWVYVPPLARLKQAPSLVVYIHGSSQSAVDAARGVRWNELADRTGVIVAYPQGPGNTWDWGQSTGFGRGYGELESLARITREVQRTYGANPKRTYVSGASSGGITATMLAALYTELYTAVAPIIACGYNCADPTGHQAYWAMCNVPFAAPEGPTCDKAKVVPAFLVHATLDHFFPPPVGAQADSQWVGTNDLADGDDGLQDGSISSIPEIDSSHMTAAPAPVATTECIRPNNNPCTGPALGVATYPYEIRRFRDQYGAGRTIVESWYIYGLAHNYPYGDPEGTFTDPTGPDVTTAALEFFERINTAPVALGDAATTVKRAPVTIAVLANDTDADGDELRVAAVSQGANGAVTHDGATVTYSPRRGFTGQDAFTYAIADGHGGSATAQVNVCVPKGGAAGC